MTVLLHLCMSVNSTLPFCEISSTFQTAMKLYSPDAYCKVTIKSWSALHGKLAACIRFSQSNKHFILQFTLTYYCMNKSVISHTSQVDNLHSQLC